MQLDLAAVISIVNLLVVLVGGTAFIIRLEGRLNVQNVRIENIETSNKTLISVVSNSAVQDEKILNIDKRLDEFAHGRGFVFPRRAFDGEYSQS